MLQQLTKSNAAIQKIVAFENAFERLLDIVTEEGNSDGGIEISEAFPQACVSVPEFTARSITCWCRGREKKD